MAGRSLARLLMDKGGAAPARVALQSAYGTITEGHDTADMKAAAALLAELNSRWSAVSSAIFGP